MGTELCPWCDRPMTRKGQRFDCLHCRLMKGKTYPYEDGWLRFQGDALTMARQIRGMTEGELARKVRVRKAQIVALEKGSPFITLKLEQKIADVLNFPRAFFHDKHIHLSDFGETTLDFHASLALCECGYCLGMRDDPLPVICPQCLAVVEGCPQCDHDLEARWRHDIVVSVYCPACGWKRNVKEGEMHPLVQQRLC